MYTENNTNGGRPVPPPILTSHSPPRSPPRPPPPLGTTSYKYKEDNVGPPTPTRSPGKKADVYHSDRGRTLEPKVAFGLKVRKHFKKFWILYVIGSIVFLAVLLPLLFLKIIPAIIQEVTNKASLDIHGGTIQAISNDEVMVSIKTVLDTPGGLTVNLDATDLHMYNTETEGFYPYATLRLPPQSLRGHNVIRVVNQTLPIQNRTELVKWLTKAFYRKRVAISVKGDTTAHLGAIKASLHIEKTSFIPGLRQLEGMKIESTRIVLPAEPDGTNLIGNITIPNYSILGMGLGNSTLNTMSGDLIIGNTTIYDAVLYPGNNTLPIRGQLFLDTLFNNISYIFNNSLLGMNLQLAVTGNSTVVNGQHIEYLEEVLNNAKLYTNISVMALLSDSMASFQGDNATASLTAGLGSLLGGLNLSSIAGSLANSTGLGSLLGGLGPTIPSNSTSSPSTLNTTTRKIMEWVS